MVESFSEDSIVWGRNTLPAETPRLRCGDDDGVRPLAQDVPAAPLRLELRRHPIVVVVLRHVLQLLDPAGQINFVSYVLRDQIVLFALPLTL